MRDPIDIFHLFSVSGQDYDKNIEGIPCEY